jgi:hypothetical protein
LFKVAIMEMEIPLVYLNLYTPFMACLLLYMNLQAIILIELWFLFGNLEKYF